MCGCSYRRVCLQPGCVNSGINPPWYGIRAGTSWRWVIIPCHFWGFCFVSGVAARPPSPTSIPGSVAASGSQAGGLERGGRGARGSSFLRGGRSRRPWPGTPPLCGFCPFLFVPFPSLRRCDRARRPGFSAARLSGSPELVRAVPGPGHAPFPAHSPGPGTASAGGRSREPLPVCSGASPGCRCRVSAAAPGPCCARPMSPRLLRRPGALLGPSAPAAAPAGTPGPAAPGGWRKRLSRPPPGCGRR